MEQEYLFPVFSITRGITEFTPDLEIITGFIILLILLCGSAITSAAEVTLFSLKPEDIEKLKTIKSRNASRVIKLHEMPERLLGTILISNNTFIVAFVLTASFLGLKLFDPGAAPVMAFIAEAVVILLILLFIGELAPKLYSSGKQLQLSLFIAGPISLLEIIFRPVTSLLIFSAAFIRKRTTAKRSIISMEDLSDALDLSSDNINEDETILKGIVNFGNTNVSEIMCPRIDVTAIDINLGFQKVKSVIIESGFSRIPVYSGSFDSIKGILYAKDILPYTGNPDNFRWQNLMRPPHFVPETKKINELLKEFQRKRNHMAVVIDEYGGASGIITLEDVLEEIVGEITDESDVEEPLFRKIDEKTFIFEGKILLNDFCKIIDVENDPFENVRGESETLAGLILELTGEIPPKGKTISYSNFRFRIESADKRRIKEVRVELAENEHVREE